MKAKTAAPRVVTMSDIARAARVHKSTVSLALRNQPGIPPETRARIQRIAIRLGYRPDPILDAFNAHRLAAGGARAPRVIAFVSDCAGRAALRASDRHHELFLGATEQARTLGHILEPFFVGPGQLSAARLQRVLLSRGITSVILGALGSTTRELSLDWTQFCGLGIESLHVEPKLDNVAIDYRLAARLIVKNMHAAGCRRAGFVIDASLEAQLAQMLRAGYLVEHAHSGDGSPVAFLFFDFTRLDALERDFGRWARDHRVDGVVTASAPTSIVSVIRECCQTHRLPFATLGIAIIADDRAGIRSGHRELGRRAVELLAIRQQTNLRGVPEHRSITYLPVV